MTGAGSLAWGPPCRAGALLAGLTGECGQPSARVRPRRDRYRRARPRGVGTAPPPVPRRAAPPEERAPGAPGPPTPRQVPAGTPPGAWEPPHRRSPGGQHRRRRGHPERRHSALDRPGSPACAASRQERSPCQSSGARSRPAGAHRARRPTPGNEPGRGPTASATGAPGSRASYGRLGCAQRPMAPGAAAPARLTGPGWVRPHGRGRANGASRRRTAAATRLALRRAAPPDEGEPRARRRAYGTRPGWPGG